MSDGLLLGCLPLRWVLEGSTLTGFVGSQVDSYSKMPTTHLKSNHKAGCKAAMPARWSESGAHQTSSLNFSQSLRAKLLPLTTTLLYFGSQVSCEIFRYQSHMAILPSYPTVLCAMRALSEHEAAITLAHGHDPNIMGII